jgi:hypothetical protein
MPEDNRSLRVFLCYSSRDKQTVRELYRKLGAEGWIDPWLDSEKLLPGQEWDIEIEKAVEQADAVLVFLSSQSVDKEGYVQKELRFVLNIAEEKPEETIFVIPLRLDDCVVPRRVRTWQYVDYFPKGQRKNAYQRLLQSLKLRAARLGISTLNVTEEQARREAEENAQKASQLQSAQKLLPDFRIRQRDYLLEISRALTQELDLEKLIERTLRVAIDILAGHSGIIVLRDTESWRVAASHGVHPDFLDYFTSLLADESKRELNISELNRIAKELIYTASDKVLNATEIPLAARGNIIGDILVFRNYSDVFTDNDRIVLKSFADQAAIAVLNAQLYSKASSENSEKGKENA